MEEIYRRKNYLTRNRYQLRYTFTILAAMLIVAVVLGGLVYWDISEMFGRERAFQIMNIDKYAVRIALLILAFFLIGIFLSHKIIGPVGRIEEALERMNRGDFDIDVKLRTGDELYHMAEQINSLAQSLKSQHPGNSK